MQYAIAGVRTPSRLFAPL